MLNREREREREYVTGKSTMNFLSKTKYYVKNKNNKKTQQAKQTNKQTKAAYKATLISFNE